MNEPAITLARQPIVDADRELVGFELLFHEEPPEAEPEPELNAIVATSTLVANAFSEIGLEQVIGPGMGFIEIDRDFLCSDLVETLPAERIVLELDEAMAADDEVLERVAALRRRGYRIALTRFVGNSADPDALIARVDMVKIDFARLDALLVPEIVALVGRHRVSLIAEGIDTPAQFHQARDLGIAWFQGFHFAVPELLTARRPRPARLAILQLLALTLHDCETHEIEETFKHHPTLVVNLLRLVNSAAYGRREAVTSLRHAIVLLGRRQLRVWLQLLLYTADRDNRALGSPLLQLAAARGKLMEQLASHPDAAHNILADLAFMTGILSVVDALFGMPMQEVLADLGAPAPVSLALLRREGDLGALLELTERLERGDAAGIVESLHRAPGQINRGDLMALQLAAYRWAGEIAAAA
jgi:EAL and modified HD-GYP domain-containing signal transduction protein